VAVETRRQLHARLLESNATLTLWSDAQQALAQQDAADEALHCADCRRVVVLTLAGRHATAEKQAHLR